MGGLCARLSGAAIGVVLTCGSASAQSAADGAAASQQQQENAAQTADATTGHDMSAMAREGSGTSWRPDSSPMYMVHRQNGPWMLMGHENAFLQYVHESGDRGAHQTGSINWLMGMAERTAGRGRQCLRQTRGPRGDAGFFPEHYSLLKWDPPGAMPHAGRRKR